MPDLSTAWTRRRHIRSDQSPSSDIYWQHYTSSLMILPEAAVPTSSPTVHRTPRPNHLPGPRVGVLRGSAATVLRGAAAPGRPEPSAEVRPGPAGAAVAPQPAATVAIPSTRPPASTVTVLAGDSLWRIAAAHLPAGSNDADVASAWPLWYAANRDVVGPDPGLIHPGQVLTAPAAEESA